MSYLQVQLRRNPVPKKNTGDACCDSCADGSKHGALGTVEDFFKSGEVWRTLIASAIGALAGALAVRTFDRATRKAKRVL